MGEEVKIFFLTGLSFHFAITFKDPPFGDGDDGGGKVPKEFPRGMDFHPPLGIHFSLHVAIDDERIDTNLSFDDCCFPYNEGATLEDLTFKLSIEAEDPFKGHLSFKDGFLSQEGANVLHG